MKERKALFVIETSEEMNGTVIAFVYIILSLELEAAVA